MNNSTSTPNDKTFSNILGVSQYISLIYAGYILVKSFVTQIFWQFEPYVLICLILIYTCSAVWKHIRFHTDNSNKQISRKLQVASISIYAIAFYLFSVNILWILRGYQFVESQITPALALFVLSPVTVREECLIFRYS